MPRRVKAIKSVVKRTADKTEPTGSCNVKDTADPHAVLRFERLLSDLSATFVNLPSEQIDKEIQRWMGRIGTLLEMDIGVLGQFSENLTGSRFTHTWTCVGVELPAYVPTARDYPWISDQITSGKIVQFTDVKDLPEEAAIDKDQYVSIGVVSSISIPLSVGGTIIGGLSFSSRSRAGPWSDSYLERYKLLGAVFANALMRKRSDKALREAFEEIRILKERLEAENVYLRQQVRRFRNYEGIIGESVALQRILSQAEQVAASDATVLIQGETGTGKELIADAIHNLSRRRERVMVKVNCAAIPETLIESELFGRERGAFTGAGSREIGRFETAHHGTILLDEAGELPLQLQSKLLRVLQDGTFERLGSSKTIKVDVRIIASTNKDLMRAVQEGNFRADLYYRLNVFTITVPPLRDRKEDIPALIWWFTNKCAEKMGKKIETISGQAMAAYQQYSWPGNVRELMNAVERSVILSQGTELDAYIPLDSAATSFEVLPLSETERENILKALYITNWRVRGRGGAAELLRIKPTTLASRMKKLGIRRPTQTTIFRA